MNKSTKVTLEKALKDFIFNCGLTNEIELDLERLFTRYDDVKERVMELEQEIIKLKKKRSFSSFLKFW